MADEKDFVVKKGWLLQTKQDFAKRWNIDFQDDEFYNRCITIVSNMVKNDENFYYLSREIYLIAGKRFVEPHRNTFYLFKYTALYEILHSFAQDDLFSNFLKSIEYIINFYHKGRDENLLATFNDIACISNLSVRLCYNDEYKFYPSGVELFDKKLVDDILEFLQPYPNAHKELSEALQEFLKKSYRDAVDKTRLALEIFLKELLNNDKSLENQKDELCRYFGNKIHTNIKSMFLNILDLYAKFNNDKAKHNSGSFNEYEVEFLFYLVGNFIRLFMQIEKDKQIK